MSSKASKLKAEEPITATVRETINPEGKSTKVLQYETEIEPNKDDIQDDLPTTEDESFINEILNNNSFEEIPKNPVELMFEELNYLVNGNVYSTFYASINRLPDLMSDSFYIPYRGDAPAFIGKTGFTLKDIFDFVPAIQKQLGNTGARVSVTVYDTNGNIVQVPLNIYQQRKQYRPVGIPNLYIPNPVTPIEKENSNGKQSDIAQALLEIAKMQQSNHNQLMQVLNRKPEQTPLEQAIQQKVLNDILNPPKPTENSGTEWIKQIMLAPVVMQEMATGFRDAMKRPEPPPVKEPTTLDTVKEVLALPQVENISNMVFNAADLLIASKIQNQAVTVNQQQNGTNQLTGKDDENMQLITDILEELESENPLDENNEFVKNLATDYPEKAAMLKASCKMMSFEAVQTLLIEMSKTVEPNPILPLLDREAMEAVNNAHFVFNERGNYVINRLKEFYELVKLQN